MLASTLDELETTYVVLRPLSVGGGVLDRGEVVDVSSWHRVAPLVRDRRIAQILTPEARAALPGDYELPSLTYETPVAPVQRVEAPVVKRRPGRPRKEA